MATKDNKDTDKIEQTEQQQKEAAVVAAMSLKSIILALHQIAVEKSNASSKKIKLVNSAIDDKSGELTSAGEHIVSAIPLEQGGQVIKSDAIDVLKSYVQWFVGPDLANKVNDKTVSPLTEAPGVPQPKEEKEGEKKKEGTTNESKKFMTFKQFLLEADEKDAQEKEANDIDTDADDNSKEPRKDTTSTEDEEEDDAIDEGKASKFGYYVTYKLDIQGMKQTALKDALMKSALKIFTFFDDATISFESLFGGTTGSISGKDIRDKIKDKYNRFFGPIDPDELVQNIYKKISIKYPKTSNTVVDVRDKKTLILDLGKQIDGQQKKKIDSSNYSIFIKVDEDDPKKPILNPRLVADIVTSSIKGLFKKWKNALNKNDVIYIENYTDASSNPKKIKELYAKVPTPDDITKVISSADDANTVHTKIEKLLSVIERDPLKSDCPRARLCFKTWQDFNDSRKVANDTPETRKTIVGKDKVIKYYEPFSTAYAQAFKQTEQKSMALDESLSAMQRLNCTIAQILLEQLLPEADESKDGDSKTTTKYTAEDIRKNVIDVLKAFGLTDFASNDKVHVGSKDFLAAKLKYYKGASSMDFGDYKNGVLVCQSSETLRESTLENSVLKRNLLKLLFEASGDKGTSTTTGAKELANALKKALEELDITDYADRLIELEMESLSEPIQLNEDTNVDFARVESAFKQNLIATSDKLDPRPIAHVGLANDVRDWLGKYGLVDSSIENRFDDFKYAAAHVLKIATKMDGIVRGGSMGFKKFNNTNVKEDLVNALDRKNVDVKIVSYKKTANSNLLYYKSDIPAKCLVRVMFFDIQEAESTRQEKKSSSDLEQKKRAYVLPFGRDGEIPLPKSDKIDVDSIGSSGKHDAYIIPMPRLNYKDEE